MSDSQNKILRKIGGIKLINTGLKGIEIMYETIEIVDGVSYDSEDWKKSIRPAHRELKNLVKELLPHLAVLSGHELVNHTHWDVVGITAGTDRFLINGKLKCWGDKIIAVNTPLIKEADEYEGFDDVMELVQKIYTETDLFLRGVKKTERKEIIEDYMNDVKKEEGFTYDKFEHMSEEEQEDLMAEMEKSMGGISVHMEGGKMVIGSDEETINPVIAEAIEAARQEDDFEVPQDVDFDLPATDVDFEVALEDQDIPIAIPKKKIKATPKV